MDEVDPQPVDLGAELRQVVQPLFGRPPVIAVGPIAAQLLQVG
jgi:hypothetical protein